MLDDQIADDLQHDGASDHQVADVIGEKELHIVGIDIKHDHRDAERNGGERNSRHASMRADSAYAAAQLKTFPDHIGQLVQNFREIAASPFLQQDGGNKEMYIEQRNARSEFLESDLERQAEIVFLERAPEFARQRL